MARMSRNIVLRCCRLFKKPYFVGSQLIALRHSVHPSVFKNKHYLFLIINWTWSGDITKTVMQVTPYRGRTEPFGRAARRSGSFFS